MEKQLGYTQAGIDEDKQRYVAIGKTKLMGTHQFGSLSMRPKIAPITPELIITQAIDRLTLVTEWIVNCPKKDIKVPNPIEVIARFIGGKRFLFFIQTNKLI